MGTSVSSAGWWFWLSMNPRQGLAEVAGEGCERAPKGGLPGDDHIVEAGLGPGHSTRSQGLAQAAAYAIANDSCPEALGHREAESWTGGRAIGGSRLGLEHEGRARPPSAATDRQKLGPFAQRDERMRRAAQTRRRAACVPWTGAA